MHTTFHGDDSWAPDGSCRRGAASSSPGRSAGERARRLKTWLVVLLCSSPVSAWAQTPAPAAPPPTGDAPDAAPPAHDAPSEAPNDAGDAPPGTAEQAPDQPSPPPQGGQDTTTATPDAPAGTDAGAAAAPSGIQPPRLERFVAAALPEGTPVAEGEQVVLLQLTIDAGGQVTDATVLESSGQPAYDDAARSAALAFTFAPATRDGVPIPARIRYRYLFAPPKVERQTPKDAELSLRVLDLQGKALAGVEVWLLKPDGKGQSMALSDAQGRASLTQVPPGRYRLTLSLAGYQPLESAETLAPGEALALKFRLRPERPADDPEAFVATAVVDPPAREVTRRTIRSQELVRIPGTRGDALRAVELLPGVARPPFGAGLLIVRGSAPGDSETFIEGSAIPLVYHFGGLTSVVNSRLLERIDFYPGNFSVRYGRRIGGILDVGLRDPADDRLHGVIDLNIIDASVLAEGPVNDKLSVAVAARRSYIDFFFDALVPDDAFDVIAAPVYWDYQLIASYRPTTRDRVRVVGYGSSDDLRLILSEPADTDPNFRGDLNLGTRFHRVDAAWRRQLSDAVDQDISVSVGPNAIDFGAGPDLDFDLDFVQIYSRAEWRARLNSKLRLIGGFDLFIAPFTIETRGLPVQQSEGE
ncbi:MAG: TonB family protein, partial [Polyangiales bacterium]